MTYDLPPHPRIYPGQTEEWYRTRERDYWSKVDEITRRRIDSVATGGLLHRVNRRPELYIRWCANCQRASGPYPDTDERVGYCGSCCSATPRYRLEPE